MIAAIDNTFLTLLLNPEAVPRPNPLTGQAATHCRQRIEALVDSLSGRGSKLIVPTPAIAEALCCAGASERLLEELDSYDCIEIADFNSRAASELGRIIREAKNEGDKRSGQQGEWQHVKMDRMIVAIAVAHDVEVFYSDDGRQSKFAELAGLKTQATWDLPLPPKYAQGALELGSPNDGREAENAAREVRGSGTSA